MLNNILIILYESTEDLNNWLIKINQLRLFYPDLKFSLLTTINLQDYKKYLRGINLLLPKDNLNEYNFKLIITNNIYIREFLNKDVLFVDKPNRFQKIFYANIWLA